VEPVAKNAPDQKVNSREETESTTTSLLVTQNVTQKTPNDYVTLGPQASPQTVGITSMIMVYRR